MGLAAAAGFDPIVVARLGFVARAWLAALGALNVVATLIAGASAGYVCDLVFADPVLGFAGGAAVALFWFNVLRLTIAAGALAPHLPPGELSRWRPPRAPLLFLALFGVFFAQPVLMFAAQPRLDTAAEESARVERAVRQEGPNAGAAVAPPAGPTSDGRLVQRVRALWQRPLLAALATILVAALLGGGTMVRILGLGPTRAYEALRHADERAAIVAAYATHQRALDATFVEILGYAPRAEALYEDPPFNRRPRLPGPPGKRVKLGADELRRALRR